MGTRAYCIWTKPREHTMEELKRRFLRQSRKLTDMYPIACLFTFAIITLSIVPSSFILRAFGLRIVEDVRPQDMSGFTYMTSAYMAFVGVWPVLLLAILIPPANRRMLKDILPNGRGNTLAGIALGILGGFVCNAVCIAISMLIGDVALSFDLFEPVNLLILYGAVLVQSGAEEIMDRQFLYEKLRRRYKSPWVAIIGNSIFFAALHLPNPGITAVSVAQIFTVGVLFSLFVYYFDSLWAAIFFHTTWNYTQNIIFGCPNSGVVSAYSIFKMDAASTGPFFDATFGVEGSVGAVCILVALCVGAVVYAKRNRLQPQDLWADLNEPSDDRNDYGPVYVPKAEPRQEQEPAAEAPSAPRHFAK